MTPSRGSVYAQLLDELIERAPRLQAAGVRRVRFTEYEVEIDPPLESIAQLKGVSLLPMSEGTVNPLDDPMTYGSPDRPVPGYPREPTEE